MAGNNSITRRNWLKKAGSFAVVPAGAMSSGHKKTEKLPELRNRDGVVRYMEVPKAWVEHKRRVKSVRDKVEEGYLRRKGVREISMERAPETHGEKHGFQVSVSIERNRVNAEIPDHVDDVPINTVDHVPTEHVCYNHSYGDLPPGVQILNDDSGSGVSVGTTAWPVHDGWGTYILTANHIGFSGNIYGDEDSFGVTKVGDVHGGDSSLDLTLIGSSRSISTTIQGDGNTYPIGGWITEEGIEERVSNYWDGYRKVGRTTGETTGGLTACHVTTSKYSYNGEGVRGGANGASGDSGGPAFDVIQGEAYLEYLVSATQNPSSSTACSGATIYKKSLGPATYEVDKYYPTINA